MNNLWVIEEKRTSDNTWKELVCDNGNYVLATTNREEGRKQLRKWQKKFRKAYKFRLVKYQTLWRG